MTLNNLNQPRAPFLQRNWLKGIKNRHSPCQTNGYIASAPLVSHGLDIGHASKRRRLSTPTDSLHFDHLHAYPETSDTPSALRIEIFSFHHKDYDKVPPTFDDTASSSSHVVTTKANCRIIVNDLTDSHKRVLHCQSQICHLTTTFTPLPGSQRMAAKVQLPNPFLIPFQSLCVNRDDGTFTLPHTHELVIEFESATGNTWLPLDLSHLASQSLLSDISPGFLLLTSRFERFYGRLKEPLISSLRHQADRSSSVTDYVMDIDLRWSSGFTSQKRLDKDTVVPHITHLDPNTVARPDNSTPIVDQDRFATIAPTTDENMVQYRSDNEQAELAITPSRSLRTRKRNKVYNLKKLTDQAFGKDQKKRSDAGFTVANGRVSYLLPSDHPVLLDCYRCVTCGSCHESLSQLQMHLQTCHLNYDYNYENTSQGPRFRVHHRCSDVLFSPSKKFLVKPTAEPFNLQTYISGNATWVTSRLVDDADDDLPKIPLAQSSSPETPGPETPGPETPSVKIKIPISKSSACLTMDGASCSSVEQPTLTCAKASPPERHDKTNKASSSERDDKTSKASSPERHDKTNKRQALVPKTSRPLYHPISKAELRPGDPVPSANSDPSWLVQKHRESIAEFSDVTPEEKEFIWEWDGYILRQNITANLLLSHAWLRFVKLKTEWLLAKPKRMHEFGKHACVLIAREALTHSDIREALDHIYTMRSLRPIDASNSVLPSKTEAAAGPKDAHVRQNSNGCTVCQRPVRGPRLLVCANKACSKRLYHSDCIEATAVVDVSDYDWFCNSCALSATE